MSDYQETLYQGYGQRFSIDNMLHEVRTEHQHLVIFENARMGRVMAPVPYTHLTLPTNSLVQISTVADSLKKSSSLCTHDIRFLANISQASTW